jgi:dipeptidyl aminopeptidase/acylaminoacyl peptidase
VQSLGARVVFLGASPAEARAVIALDPATRETATLYRPDGLSIPERYLSLPEPVEFPTQGDRTAYGLFYPPRNDDFAGPPGERPPLVVMIHGGPTSAASPALRPGIQFYTSRGIAVLDVNYGGSTGFGRAYRERLYGQWGIVDVEDCVSGAAWLTERGQVDGARLAITGGSAGGYTALACLTFRRLFAAGASHYGVSDCELLAQETHKFEARYLDQLIGPYPERRDLYLARSPLRHVERLDRPVIFFQGLDDQVVPPNQSARMFEELRRKGVPTAYVAFAGEQHGFRKAETIRRALEGELYFFSRIFGFTPADPVPPVPIENL